MPSCEKCWKDAQLRAAVSQRSVVECYHELLEERKDSPCTEKEQKGEFAEAGKE